MAVAKRPPPGISDDTRFFWEGARAGKLLIQRCSACQTLRHPPGPVCPSCHSFEWDALQASGRGKVYSFVVMHYPEVPPFEHPNLIVLVELEEGTRLISQLVGIPPGDVRIGQAVQVEFLTLVFLCSITDLRWHQQLCKQLTAVVINRASAR